MGTSDDIRLTQGLGLWVHSLQKRLSRSFKLFPVLPALACVALPRFKQWYRLTANG